MASVTNLFGPPTTGASVIYGPGGNVIFTAVQNRVVARDIIKDVSVCLPFEARSKIAILVYNESANMLVTIDEYGHACFFDVTRYRLLQKYNFKLQVRAAAFSPNGRVLVLLIGQGVEMWSITKVLNNIQMLRINSFPMTSAGLCLSTAPGRVLIGYSSGEVRIYDTLDCDKGEHVVDIPLVEYPLKANLNSLIGVFWIQGGLGIIAVSREGEMAVWRNATLLNNSTNDEEMVRDFEGEGNTDGTDNKPKAEKPSKNPFRFCGTYNLADAFGKSGELRLGGHKFRASLYSGPKSVSSVDIDESSQYLAVGLESGLVFMFRLMNMENITTETLDDGVGVFKLGIGKPKYLHHVPLGLFPIISLDFHPENPTKCLKGDPTSFAHVSSAPTTLLASTPMEISLWDYSAETRLYSSSTFFTSPSMASVGMLNGLTATSYGVSRMTSFAVSPDGLLLATVGFENTQVWNIRTGGRVAQWPNGGSDVVFLPTSRGLLTVYGNTIYAFDLNTGKRFREIVVDNILNRTVTLSSICVDSSSAIVAVVTNESISRDVEERGDRQSAVSNLKLNTNSVVVIDLRTQELLDDLAGHTGPIVDILWSEDMLVSASWDGYLVGWNIFGGSEEPITIKFESQITAITAMDGLVYTALANGDIQIVDFEREAPIHLINTTLDMKGGKMDDLRDFRNTVNTINTITVAQATNSFSLEGGRASKSKQLTTHVLYVGGMSRFIVSYLVNVQRKSSENSRDSTLTSITSDKYIVSANRGVKGTLDRHRHSHDISLTKATKDVETITRDIEKVTGQKALSKQNALRKGPKVSISLLDSGNIRKEMSVEVRRMIVVPNTSMLNDNNKFVSQLLVESANGCGVELRGDGSTDNRGILYVTVDDGDSTNNENAVVKLYSPILINGISNNHNKEGDLLIELYKALCYGELRYIDSALEALEYRVNVRDIPLVLANRLILYISEKLHGRGLYKDEETVQFSKLIDIALKILSSPKNKEYDRNAIALLNNIVIDITTKLKRRIVDTESLILGMSYINPKDPSADFSAEITEIHEEMQKERQLLLQKKSEKKIKKDTARGRASYGYTFERPE